MPADLTPAALPADLSPDLVVTIQPAEMVFTTPAPLSLPNRAGWAPGTRMNLWSINPTTGTFDDVGKGQVSADGSVINTISGGIRNSSWHFFSCDLPPPDHPREDNPGCHSCSPLGDASSLVNLNSGCDRGGSRPGDVPVARPDARA